MMKQHFTGYYRPNEDEFKFLWQHCIFVLDTNVLPNLYRYPLEARKDLLQILNKISDRLWIPHQVALEYQENRPQVISEQVQRYREVKEVIEACENTLRADLENLQLKKRHSSIDPDTLLSKISAIASEFKDELSGLENKQLCVSDEDALREEIDAILNSRVGSAPENQEWLENVYKEGKIRYELRRPPGYMDNNKKFEKGEASAYFYGDLVCRREYGDLIIWKQIIDKLQKDSDSSNKCLLFITDDNKEDWWWIVNSNGKKTIGPRPELFQELKHKANVKYFYMYTSERFMKFAEEYLNIQVKEESISQVRDIARTRYNNPRDFMRQAHEAEKSVLRWLEKNYPDDDVTLNRMGFPDIVRINNKQNLKVGYEVKFYRQSPDPQRSYFHAFTRIRDILYRGYYEVNEGDIDELNIVLVMESAEQMSELQDFFDSRRIEIPNNVSIKIGFMTRSGGEQEDFEFMLGYTDNNSGAAD